MNPVTIGWAFARKGSKTASVVPATSTSYPIRSPNEAIRLTLPAGQAWSSLWVSSLDSGGSNSAESGILYWGDNPTVFVNSFSFAYGIFGTSVEGDLFGHLPASFDATAKYLLFMNNPDNGPNNDYLVWKGATIDGGSGPQGSVPEPASIALLGLGLAGLSFSRRGKLN